MKHQRGFSLLDILITLAVLVILVTVAVPSFSSMIYEARMTSIANTIVSHAFLARTGALKRKHPVTICSSSDGATCAESIDWGIGWIVFADRNGNGTVDDSEEIIKVAQGAHESQTLVAGQPRITYLPRGTIKGS